MGESTSETDEQPRRERTIAGRYRLENELGHGAMGSVWLAVDVQLQRTVAVKRMTGDHLASPAARRSFAREAVAIAHLSSPHVVQVHDYGMDGDVPFIVMELLQGEDLEARLARQPRLPPTMIASILCQAAKALDLAHGAGMVHRDLKPANMFLARTGAEEVLKLLDFGIAAWRTSLSSEAPDGADGRYLLGTPPYLSPEQAWGTSPVDHRSDLWSLGVIAYQALTGLLPFAGVSMGETFVKIYSEPPPTPSTIVPEVGPGMDRFFQRALARDPALRYPSASEMAAAFVEVVERGGIAQRAKILVIDDEPDVAALMEQYFRDKIRCGVYEFVFASDGAEALEKLRDHPDLDVALTDLRMPRMDGLAFLERAGAINPILRVVVVSAYGDMANVRTAMNRGAFDFLVKPIDLDDLELTIDKTLKHVRAVRRTIQSAEENNILKMFLSSGVVERLLPGMRAAGAAPGELVEATVAFVDVFGFNAAVAHMTPTEAVRLLNAHFELIGPEITAKGGVIDKFVGDAVMAVFRGQDHLTRAVEACLSIRRQLAQLAALAGEGSPFACGVSIGLDTGEVIASSIGSMILYRLDYTVLGRVVGNAARLQAVAGRGQILVTEGVREDLGASFECAATAGGSDGGGRTYDVVRRSKTLSRGSHPDTEAT